MMDSMLHFDSVFSKTLTYLFPKDCFEEFFIRYNFLNEECMKLVLSRFLGLAITLGATLIFIPQILKIWTAKSGKGVSLLSQMLSLIGCTGTAGYSYALNFVFSQWGDTLFVSIQTAVVIAQILWYDGCSTEMAAFLLAYSFVGGAMWARLVPFGVLQLLQMSTIPIVIVARGLQAQANWRNGSTGQLAAVSVFLQFAGCLARIFTSMQETDDQLIVGSYVVAALMNGVIFGQVLIYWGKKPKRD